MRNATRPTTKTITKVSIADGNCSTARRVVLAYERAITSSYSPTNGTSRTGVCFPRQTFGACTIAVNGRRYQCNRPEGSGLTLPATCKRQNHGRALPRLSAPAVGR